MCIMNCLVLGGAGFLGSHIVDALVEGGAGVRVFDLPNIDLSNLRHHERRIEIMGGDFNNVHDITRALEGMDIVIHLISTTLPGPSNENPEYDVKSNVIGTLQLLDKSIAAGVKKVIFSSSGGTVYGIPRILPIPENHGTDPICSYGITKLSIEKYLHLYYHLYGLKYTVLRLGNPYGERQRTDNVQGAIAVFLGKALRGERITIWGDGLVARDYFYVKDAVNAFLCAIGKETPPDTFNIAGGRAVTLIDIISSIETVTGKKLEVNFTSGRKLDVSVNCLDIRRAEKIIGWRPEVSLHEGIERTWSWLKNRRAAG